MPLTESTKKFLEMIYSQPKKSLSETPIKEQREASLLGDNEFTAPKHDVGAIETRQIPGPNGPIPIRIYTPIKTETNGAIVFFNGSGFIHGSLELADHLCRDIANVTGTKVIAVAYRSAPENPYPIGLQDAFAATKWVIDSETELKIDGTKVGVAGESSGANFAALTAIHARDHGWPLFFQCLVAPVLDLACTLPSHQRNKTDYLLEETDLQWLIDQYAPKNINRQNPAISPFYLENLAELPQTIVATAEYDLLVDEGELYAKRLKEAGVAVEYLCFKGAIHFFCNFRGVLKEPIDPVEKIGTIIKKFYDTP